MQLGMIGLGRMGSNMVKRLMKAGHECAVFDLNPATVKGMAEEGAKGATEVADFKNLLKAPRAIWVMVPSGDATEGMVKNLIHTLESGDIIIDGGNSYYKDDVRRAKMAAEKGIHYVDAGTSGGVWGFERGYCLMIGGEREIVEHLDPIFKSLAPGESGIAPSPGRTQMTTADLGYLYCGPNGAGHFAKMVHNGIEYGVMQAYAEGFDILKNANSEALEADHRYNINLPDLAETWRRGSVIGSWLLDLTAMALIEDPELARYTGFVQDSGEGRWTIQAAIEEAVPAEVLTAALFARFRSRQEHTFAEKMLSAMRNKFGGHVELHAAKS
jgi:6-phosphogluconate dehydrogenase